jgi:uncharacterized membrane protein YjdF
MPSIVFVPHVIEAYPRFPARATRHFDGRGVGARRAARALIFVHACMLMLGGAYGHARVPLGFWPIGERARFRPPS